MALVEAIAGLEKIGILADWNFVFLGDGPLQDAIQSSINEHALQNRIQIMPTTQSMPAVYQASDLFILPSLYEGMSNALLEAAASGCPIIVNKAADNVGVINDERGWVAEKSLKDTLETVISLPGDKRTRKAKNAAAYIKRIFSNEKMINDTAELYQTVAKPAPLN